MAFQTFIVAVVQNSDGSLRVTLSTLDQSFSTQITLPADEAPRAYIGRAVDITIAYKVP